MKLGPLRKLEFIGLIGLCACSPITEAGSKSPITLYPTAELGNNTEQDQLEKAVAYLKQVYPDAEPTAFENGIKDDGNSIIFVSATSGMQIEPQTYLAFQKFLVDNKDLLLPPTFDIDLIQSQQIVYLIPRSVAKTSSDPLRDVTRTITQIDNPDSIEVTVTFVIIEDNGEYLPEHIATEIAQATYRENTQANSGLTMDPMQEVAANSIGFAYGSMVNDGLSYSDYVNRANQMHFDVNGEIYNIAIVSSAFTNYAMYSNILAPGYNLGFIRHLN